MSWRILQGDVRETPATLPDESAHCCVTSPPYWGLRDYGVEGQLGLEATPEEYVANMVAVFREVRRVLRDDGTLWMNLGDSYATGGGKVGQAPGGGKQGENWKLRGTMTPPNRMPLPGLKPKDLVGIPWRVAFALQADGWYLRSDIIWAKPNPMPESVTDRPTKAHEYLFLLAKSERYYYDADAIAEPAICGWNGSYFRDERDLAVRPSTGMKPRQSAEKGSFNGKTKGVANGNEAFRAVTDMRNRRTVWTVATQPFSEAHFATFPPKLIEPCILAGCPEGGTVLDPFSGSGTTGMVALRCGRNYIGCELNPEYVEMSNRRIRGDSPLFNASATQVLA